MRPKLIETQNGRREIFISASKFIIPGLYIRYLIIKLGAKLIKKTKTMESSWYEIEIESQPYELTFEEFPFGITLTSNNPDSKEKIREIYFKYFNKNT